MNILVLEVTAHGTLTQPSETGRRFVVLFDSFALQINGILENYVWNFLCLVLTVVVIVVTVVVVLVVLV